MGILDGFFGPTQEEKEKSYAKGVEAAKEGGLINNLLYDGPDIIPDSWKDEKFKAEQAGYHDYNRGNAPDWAYDDEDDE